MAVGQLVTGPLSDRWGRRRPVLVGLGAYVLLALACAAAPSAELLAAARFAQGFAGGTGVVVARAVVRDLYSGRAAAKYFSRLTLVFGVVPVAAPSLGSLVLGFTSWRAVFVILAADRPAARRRRGAAGCPRRCRPHRRSTGGLRASGRTARPSPPTGSISATRSPRGSPSPGSSPTSPGRPSSSRTSSACAAPASASIFGLNAVAFVALGQLNGRLVDRYEPRRLLVTALTVGAGHRRGAAAGAPGRQRRAGGGCCSSSSWARSAW